MTVIYLYEGGFRAVLDRMNGIFRFSREAGWDIRPLEVSELRGGIVKACAYWGAAGLIVEGGLAPRRALSAGISRTRLPVDAAPRSCPGRSSAPRSRPEAARARSRPRER